MQNQSERIKSYRIWDTCPWIYGMDDETLNDLIENKKTRNEIVDIELNKYFEKSVDKKSLFIKYERKNEILEIMERVPYEKSIWSDLSNAWKIKLITNDKINDNS